MALKDIKTIIIVMLENRSFDHMVGYLNLPSAKPRIPLEGLSDDPAWQREYANVFGGKSYPIDKFSPSVQKFIDPPHDLKSIDVQINTRPNSGPPDDPDKMGGFVASYANAIPKPNELGRVMGYYTKESVPIFDFFARNFAICDHWFSSLPSSTQPNRLMAMSGESQIADNVASIRKFPDQTLVYDWLNRNKISWCSYQWSGFPFFMLMKRWRLKIVGSLNDAFSLGTFRFYDKFFMQWSQGDDIPNVVFIEPKYTDDPTFSRPNDDHPPTGIAKGQQFVADIYNTLIRNKDLWAKTMMIVTYDEHGGFFDHVTPLSVPVSVGGRTLPTTGVRVPAFIVSPHVEPGTVFNKNLDHTSILRLLADRFTKGKDYSPAVAARQKNFEPLAEILRDKPPASIRTPKIPMGMLEDVHIEAVAASPPLPMLEPFLATPTAKAFHEVALAVAAERPDLFAMPGWIGATEYVAMAKHRIEPGAFLAASRLEYPAPETPPRRRI